MAGGRVPFEMKKKILLGILIAVGGFLVYRAARVLRYWGCRDSTFEMVRMAADTDEDDTTSEVEWRRAYEEMGVPYDAAHPQRLSMEQMVDYVDRHSERMKRNCERYREAHRMTPEEEDADDENFEVRTRQAWHESALASLTERQGLSREAMDKEPGKAIPILISLLSSFKDREPAAIALGHIGRPAIPHLLPLLRGQNQTLRRWSCYSLEIMGPEAAETLPDLLRLVAAQDPSDFSMAADVIRNLGPQGKAAIPLLIPGLKRREPYARISAALALGGIGPEAREAIPALKEALSMEDSNGIPYFRRSLRKIEAQPIKETGSP
jgi:hypothetical protein